MEKRNNVKTRFSHLLIDIFRYIFLSVFVLSIINVNAHADKRDVRVGVYANKPLVYQDENGNYKGLSIDVLRFVASKENWELEFVPCSWPKCLKMIKNGENDIQVIIAKTPERIKIYDFTNQALYSLWAQIFIHPDSDIESWTDLKGKNVAVYKDDLFSETFKKLIKEFNIDCSLLKVEDYHAMIKLIKEKKADAGVFIQTFAEPYAIRGIVRRTPIMFNPVPIYYAFPKGKVPELVTAIDSHLKTLKEDTNSIYYQSLDRIFEQEKRIMIPPLIKWIMIVVFALLLLFLTISVITRRQVAVRTTELMLKTIDLEKGIGERKQAEEALKKSEERLQSFMDSATDGFILFDSELNHIEMNKAALEITGLKREDVIGKNLIDTVPDIKGTERYAEYKKVMKTCVPFYIHDITNHPLTGDKHIELKAFKVNDGLGMIFNDITKAKLAEQQTKSSLKEKEILLKELYHRTKNNMQVIIAMINLQTNNIEDENILQMFKETKNRIMTMALVHEKLCQAKDLSRIDLKDYFTELINLLESSYQEISSGISFKKEMNSVLVSFDSAIPCGLIINELISNVFKHAFPENRSGEIQINLKITDDEEIEFSVSDNGIGLPEGLDIRSADTLGFQSVVSLAEHQLTGSVKVVKDNGAQFHITFKEGSCNERV